MYQGKGDEGNRQYDKVRQAFFFRQHSSSLYEEGGYVVPIDDAPFCDSDFVAHSVVKNVGHSIAVKRNVMISVGISLERLFMRGSSIKPSFGIVLG